MSEKLDREVVLVMAGALAMLFGWLMFTHSHGAAARVFACEPVQSLDGPKVVVTCETPSSGVLAVEMVGMALGVFGFATSFIGAVNISR